MIMIRQFHEFFNLIFGGFLTFGPTGTHSSPPSSAAATAAAPSSVSLSEPRAGALLLLPLLFGTVLYVDIESESSTRKSRRARFPPTTTVTTQWQIFEISFRFQFHRRFASQSRDGGSGGRIECAGRQWWYAAQRAKFAKKVHKPHLRGSMSLILN